MSVIEIDLPDEHVKFGMQYAERIGLTFDELINLVLENYIQKNIDKKSLDNTDDFVSVVKVIPKEDYSVNLYFSNGYIKRYDAKHLIDKGVFKQISNIDVFMKTCTILNGTLAWHINDVHDSSNYLDLDPETIYKTSQIIGLW